MSDSEATKTVSNRTGGQSKPSKHNRPKVNGAEGQPKRTREQQQDQHHQRPADKKPRTDAQTERNQQPQPQPQPQQPPTAAPTNCLFHPFRANFCDHFETSLDALRDVLPAITELRQLTRPSAPDAFAIYDPYYCSGTIVDHWHALGVTKVLHENRDFYEDIKHKTVPGPYDMLVTNPPFSDDHVQRMMRFLINGQDRPWAFLAPDYIVSKPWYREMVRTHFTPAPPTGKGKLTATGRAAPPPRVSGPIAFELPPFLRGAVEAAAAAAAAASEESKEEEVHEDTEALGGDSKREKPSGSSSSGSATPVVVGPEPFYIVPKERYDFKHPTGAGRDHSHFKSMWYVWPGRRLPEVLRGTTVALISRPSRDGHSHNSHIPHKAGSGGPAVVHGLAALDEAKLVTATERRVNPQRRQQKFGGKPNRW